VHPNRLILLTAGNLSPLDLAVYGNAESQSPALNRLASEGTVFHEFYRSSQSIEQAIHQAVTKIGNEREAIRLNEIDHIEDFSTEAKVLNWIRLPSRVDQNPEQTVEQLEAICSTLTAGETLRDRVLLITSEAPSTTAISTGGDSRFGESGDRSLTLGAWAPLIIVKQAHDDRTHCREQSLVSADELSELIVQLISATDEIDLNIGQEEIVLETDARIGLRTKHRLLIVEKSEIAATSPNSLETVNAELYAKPEDRFDLNDISANEPELCEELLQRLISTRQAEQK